MWLKFTQRNIRKGKNSFLFSSNPLLLSQQVDDDLENRLERRENLCRRFCLLPNDMKIIIIVSSGISPEVKYLHLPHHIDITHITSRITHNWGMKKLKLMNFLRGKQVNNLSRREKKLWRRKINFRKTFPPLSFTATGECRGCVRLVLFWFSCLCR